ncbi:MAG: GyrI-like domain-containing protein, partial [Anaerolineae bacterium]
MSQRPVAATIESLLAAMPDSSASVASALHGHAVAHSCAYRVEAGETGGSHTLIYSGMGLEVRVDGEAVTLRTDYDLRAFLDFYRNRADEATKALLFEAAIPCCFCMDDKCTTVLTDRRIYLGGKVKQLCGPYRHRLELAVTAASVGLMGPILDMAFRYCAPDMHQDVSSRNDVTYAVESAPEFYVVGYRHRSTMLSVRTEDFVKGCFDRGEDGQSKLDALAEAIGHSGKADYVGVTRDFADGLDYVYVLGVACEADDVPATLPEGAEAVRIAAGEYAVYNSSVRDYASLWRHFKERFHEAEQKGYDVSRLPFEHFDAEGRFYDLSIPVAAGLPADSGVRKRVVRTPDVRLAGYLVWQETDFPLYKDVGNVEERLRRAFPNAERYVHAYTHSRPGQPACEKHGVELGPFDAIPDGMEEMTIRGGYWHACSYPYPVIPDYVLFDLPYESPHKI